MKENWNFYYMLSVLKNKDGIDFVFNKFKV